jgi:hypothetical protein
LPVAENLIEPADDRWELMKSKVEQQGPSAFDIGYQVWSRFLSTEAMEPRAYLQLLDLSAGFLVYCQVLVLSDMHAWVREDVGRGRTAVALSAGMMAWAGGYVIGLSSDYPVDHLPRMELTP